MDVGDAAFVPKKVYKVVLQDRKVKLREIAEALKTAESSPSIAWTFVHEKIDDQPSEQQSAKAGQINQNG